jgi:hypothetical protein
MTRVVCELDVKLRALVSDPDAVGAYRTVTVHCALTASVAPQVCDWIVKALEGPPRVRLAPASATVPRFLSVNTLVAKSPTATEPKSDEDISTSSELYVRMTAPLSAVMLAVKVAEPEAPLPALVQGITVE